MVRKTIVVLILSLSIVARKDPTRDLSIVAVWLRDIPRHSNMDARCVFVGCHVSDPESRDRFFFAFFPTFLSIS